MPKDRYTVFSVSNTISQAGRDYCSNLDMGEKKNQTNNNKKNPQKLDKNKQPKKFVPRNWKKTTNV